MLDDALTGSGTGNGVATVVRAVAGGRWVRETMTPVTAATMMMVASISSSFTDARTTSS
jgi:hypothetical protein